MAKDATKDRLPRGTKVVTRAFFDAASNFPEANRPDIIKAALADIRDNLKTSREKAAVRKAKTAAPAKKVAAKAPAKPANKAVAVKPQKAEKKAVATQMKATKKKPAIKKKAAKLAPQQNSPAMLSASEIADVTTPEVEADAKD